MAGILDTLSEVIKTLTKKMKGDNTISREDILESCDLVIQQQQTVIECIGALSKNEQAALLKILSHPLNKDVAEGMVTYRRAVGNTATRLDNASFLGALLEAEKRLVKLTKEISSNIDTLFTEREFTISQTKVSHAATIGIIRNANILSSFLINLVDYLQQEFLGTVKDLPRYRTVFIKKYASDVAEIVGDVIDKSGRYSFLAEIDAIRTKGQDLLLYTEGQSIADYGNSDDYRQVTRSASIGFNVVSIMMYLRNSWDNMKRLKYLQNQQLKSWMENKNALLRMKLAGIDPNSEEYIRTAEIVASYEKLITEYEKKINAYLEDTD